MTRNALTSVNILIGISALIVLFHLLVLVSVIPVEVAWGGRLKTIEEMYVFETLSVLINSFFIFVLLQKGEYVRYFFGRKTVAILLWVYFAIFALNTIGNAFARTNFEKIFTIITLFNSILIWLVNRTKVR